MVIIVVNYLEDYIIENLNLVDDKKIDKEIHYAVVVNIYKEKRIIVDD